MVIGDLQGERFHRLPLHSFEYSDTQSLVTFLNIIDDSLTAQKPQILFFVHGMWESLPIFFRSDCSYLKSNYLDNPNSQVGAVVFVAWNASPLWYGKVRKNALSVVTPFQSVLNGIAIFKQQHPNYTLDFLAHSIGNRIFLESLSQEYPELFDKVMLSAPDIAAPNEMNQDQYLHLVKIGKRILLLKNKRDKSLYLSALFNRKKRLGRIGFSTPLANNVEEVELSSFRDLDRIEAHILDHLHFKCSAKTMELMVEFLNE